jgi:hypothetical protein
MQQVCTNGTFTNTGGIFGSLAHAREHTGIDTTSSI